jgi:hypothetical protein
MDVVGKVVEEEARSMVRGFQQLSTPDVQKRMADRVASIMRPDQGSLPLDKPVDAARIVQLYTSNVVKHAIEIPEIVVLPSRRDVTFWIKDFDLEGLDRFNIQPMDGGVVVVDVRTGKREVIEVNIIGAKEQRLENYLVLRLVDLMKSTTTPTASCCSSSQDKWSGTSKPISRTTKSPFGRTTQCCPTTSSSRRSNTARTPTTYVPTVTKGFILDDAVTQSATLRGIVNTYGLNPCCGSRILCAPHRRPDAIEA